MCILASSAGGSYAHRRSGPKRNVHKIDGMHLEPSTLGFRQSWFMKFKGLPNSETHK